MLKIEFIYSCFYFWHPQSVFMSKHVQFLENFSWNLQWLASKPFCLYFHWVIPEKIHLPPPMDGILNSYQYLHRGSRILEIWTGMCALLKKKCKSGKKSLVFYSVGIQFDLFNKNHTRNSCLWFRQHWGIEDNDLIYVN